MEKKDLMSILIAKNNDYFRGTVDENSSLYLHDTQINAARKIVMQLGCNVLRTNHVMLIAKMQSGKTGVCNSVVNIINKSRLYENMGINKYMFITGMNDCGLKDQTYSRVKDQIIDANVDNIYFGKRCKRNLSENKYFVLKNSDLMKYDGVLDNTLIFIDESHYGSNEKNILTQFLNKHNVDWKDTNELIKRNIYIVSVSATPFDELVSDTVQCKKMVELETSDEYCGVTEYLNSDVVFDADKSDIDDGTIFDYIEDAYARMEENEEQGAVIIRTRKFETIKDNKFVQDNFDIFEMFAGGSKIEYSKLNDILEDIKGTNSRLKSMKVLGLSPKTKPLLVLIKGAFRAGITINESHKELIYMVYDYSAKSDTTAQALLGRMCGYRSDLSTITKTHFYINKKFANMYSSWENDFTNRDLIPCSDTKMEWVSNGYNGNDVEFGSRPCGNFYIDLSVDEIKDIYRKTKGKRNRLSIVESELPKMFARHNVSNIDYDYIGEAQLSGKNHYAKSSQEKRFDSFSKDSLVFQFRPEKIKKFLSDTNRNYLSKEDLGKKCVSIVLDATIDETVNGIEIGGNKRMLVYYVEVGQKKMMFSRKKQYKSHKDTKID